MPPKPFDLILYHGNCWDGLTSAWVALAHSPKAEALAVQYGKEPPDVTGKRVLIVDFSYPLDVLMEMWSKAEDLLVLDHHKSAEEALSQLRFAHFDMNKSGAGMAWDHLFGGDRPLLVNYVEDRDLWRFKLDSSRAHHAFMTSYPMTLEAIAEIAQVNTMVRIERGQAVLKFLEQHCIRVASKARRITFLEQEFWICNTPVELASEVGELLYEREPTLPAICWSWGSTKGDYYCSLRSRQEDGIDVSLIAKEMGGGGHKNAAGFRTRIPPPYLGVSYDEQERYDSASETDSTP